MALALTSPSSVSANPARPVVTRSRGRRMIKDQPRRTEQAEDSYDVFCVTSVAGTGHELEGLLQGQRLNEALMDLHNNGQGRRAGSEGKPVNPNSLQTIGGPDKPYNPPKPPPKGSDSYPKSAEGSCSR